MFSEVALIRFWGSRSTDFQQMKLEPFVDANKARDAADRLIQSKVRRGYRIVGGYVPPSLDAQPAGDKGQVCQVHQPNCHSPEQSL